MLAGFDQGLALDLGTHPCHFLHFLEFELRDFYHLGFVDLDLCRHLNHVIIHDLKFENGDDNVPK